MNSTPDPEVQTPRLLRGPSAWAVTFTGLWLSLVGLAAGLLSIALRWSPLINNLTLIIVVASVAIGGMALSLVLLAARKWAIKKELKAGYTTVDGHFELPRVDRRSGAVVRQPGDNEPTYRQIVARRKQALASRRDDRP
ncbi:hypothetical protein ACFVWR_15905 [Leifsonia sp. NPDC058292]|uniref:hypothetical protein n=1 Tax=Leifsonia sp. NPDC058292 TaxID=3346428 RepID=UPI0036DE8F10